MYVFWKLSGWDVFFIYCSPTQSSNPASSTSIHIFKSWYQACSWFSFWFVSLYIQNVNFQNLGCFIYVEFILISFCSFFRVHSFLLVHYCYFVFVCAKNLLLSKCVFSVRVATSFSECSCTRNSQPLFSVSIIYLTFLKVIS